MHCPQCGHLQVNNAVQFCARCGMPLGGVRLVLENGGQLPYLPSADEPTGMSPRRRGVRQGALLLFLGTLIVPLLAIFSSLTNMPEEFVAFAAVFLFVGGLLRMLYAAIFEEGRKAGALPPAVFNPEQNVGQYAPPLSFNQPRNNAALPSFQTPPVGSWRQSGNTDEITVPKTSVTESTTKLLQKDE